VKLSPALLHCQHERKILAAYDVKFSIDSNSKLFSFNGKCIFWTGKKDAFSKEHRTQKDALEPR
jgi:hypothetical protein